MLQIKYLKKQFGIFIIISFILHRSFTAKFQTKILSVPQIRHHSFHHPPVISQALQLFFDLLCLSVLF